MADTKLIFVGGFLGAGKTTLIYEISGRLAKMGKNVALITNDQAPDLVDTAILEHTGINVAEVSGSCFCCDFKALRRAMEKVGATQKPDIIIAEPVGSCTDLSATLINPIREMMNNELSVSPLTVLIDPNRLKALIEDEKSDLHPGAAYILKKQLEESDIIAVTKTDLYSTDEINSSISWLKNNFPECEVISLSSRTGHGIDKWLDTVITSNDSGRHILDIDYDRYAEGEAVLGWLNSSVSLKGEKVDWDAFTRNFMKDLSTEFDTRKSSIGHVKIMIENGDKYITSNLTERSDTLNFRWSAGIGNEAEMIMNARVEMSPEELEKVFLEILQKSAGSQIKTRIKSLKSISPGYPKPTYRYKNSV